MWILTKSHYAILKLRAKFFGLFFQIGNNVKIRDGFRAQGSNICIKEGCYINHHVELDACNGSIRIEKHVLIGQNTLITTANHRFNDIKVPIIQQGFSIPNHIFIDEGAWIGAGVIILPGVTIGKGAIIGAGSIVTKDVANFNVVAGVPAKKIGARI